MLERALENLVANVARYTPAETAVTLELARDGEDVTLTVSDDGPGIAQDELAHVTDRFFGGGDPNTRDTRGLGLGLALVQEIAQAHGGRLAAWSEPGVGSSFRLVLPARPPEPATGLSAAG